LDAQLQQVLKHYQISSELVPADDIETMKLYLCSSCDKGRREGFMTRFLLFIVYLLSDINISVIIFFTIDSEDIFPVLQSVQLVVDGGTSLGLILFALGLVLVNALYKSQKIKRSQLVWSNYRANHLDVGTSPSNASTRHCWGCSG
jgi:hypothetical protein